MSACVRLCVCCSLLTCTLCARSERQRRSCSATERWTTRGRPAWRQTESAEHKKKWKRNGDLVVHEVVEQVFVLKKEKKNEKEDNLQCSGKTGVFSSTGLFKGFAPNQFLLKTLGEALKEWRCWGQMKGIRVSAVFLLGPCYKTTWLSVRLAHWHFESTAYGRVMSKWQIQVEVRFRSELTANPKAEVLCLMKETAAEEEKAEQRQVSE